MRLGAIRFHYFMLYTVVGAYLPYAPIYLHQRGLDDSQIGWAVGVYGLAVLFVPAMMAHLADVHIANRTLLGIGFALTAGSLALMHEMAAFWPLLACSLLFSVAYTPSFSLLDGLTFAAMHEHESRGGRAPSYHLTRIFGSFGFMAPAVALAVLLWDADDVRPAIVLAGVCAAVAAMACPALPVPRREPDETPGAALPSARAWAAMKRPPVRCFMAAMFLQFLAISVFYAFFGRYLQDLGVASRWVGLVLNIGVAAEIVVLIFGGAILRAVGLRGVLIVGAAAMALRMAMLAAVPVPAVAIAVQVLHGPAVLAMYVLPPMYLNHKARPGYRNSMQGLYGALCFGVARVVGSIAGGYAAEIDLRWAFALAAALSAGALGVLVLRFRDADAGEAIERRVRGESAPFAPEPAEPRLPDP